MLLTQKRDPLHSNILSRFYIIKNVWRTRIALHKNSLHKNSLHKNTALTANNTKLITTNNKLITKNTKLITKNTKPITKNTKLITKNTEQLISFKTLWFGALWGASLPGPPAVSCCFLQGMCCIVWCYLWSGAT